jgi:hypothetical protein
MRYPGGRNAVISGKRTGEYPQSIPVVKVPFNPVTGEYLADVTINTKM